nr:M1 family metallopeptidase [Clostridia bacterium]
DTYSAKAYYAGKSYGGESVEKVEGCASWEVAGEDQNILSVTLNEPVYPEQTVEVSITYTLDLAKVNHRTGVTANTVNLGNFYPVLCAYSQEGFIETPYYTNGDPFVSECADYEVSLTTPKDYIAATSGKEVSRSVAGEVVTSKYELSRARDFAAVISRDFKTMQRKSGNCDVTLYYCGDRQPTRELDAACESLEYFSSTFGEYAYPTLSVVFTPLCVSGMEYPALTMISEGMDEADSIYTIVHENAHQWWYAMVGSDQVNCAWQDEGLAEYSSVCFFEQYPSYGFTRTAILGAAIKSYRAYYSVYNQIFGKADTSMTRPLNEFASDYEYVNVAYNKGLLMFESVRTAMGDKKFFNALKNYFNDNCFKIASQEDLIAKLSAQHDVEGVLDSYIEGKVVI